MISTYACKVKQYHFVSQALSKCSFLCVPHIHMSQHLQALWLFFVQASFWHIHSISHLEISENYVLRMSIKRMCVEGGSTLYSIQHDKKYGKKSFQEEVLLFLFWKRDEEDMPLAIFKLGHTTLTSIKKNMNNVFIVNFQYVFFNWATVVIIIFLQY